MTIKNKQIEVRSSFDINNQKLINVADPTSDKDGVNLRVLNSRVSSEEVSTLSNNSTNEEILVGNSLEDRSIIIDYVMERGLIYQEGYIRILNDDVDVFASHQFQNTADIGVDFVGAVLYTDGSITISFDVDDNIDDVTFKYIIRKISI